MTPRFVISMLALDGLEMSKACIDSVLASNCQDFQLVLTDNNSSDGTYQMFRDFAVSHPGKIAEIRLNTDNFGFISPNNSACEYARSVGAEFFITLNNDLTVPPNWLDEFIRMFETYPKLAVSGPRGTISEVNKNMIGDSAAKYTFAEGSCMCVRLSMLEPGEPLFANYLSFIYFDDLQLSLRMQRRGLEVRQANFKVLHRNGSTCTRHPEAIRKCREAMQHNHAVMLQKWGHWNKVRRFDFPILFRRTFATGDALLMTPVIRAMHELWPLCPIDVETNATEVFKGNPLVRKCSTRIKVEPETMVVDLNGAYERKPRLNVLEAYARVAGVDAAEVVPKCELYGYTKWINPGGRWCAVHIGPTTWPGRNWPMDRWRSVINALKRNEWRIMLFGDKSREEFEAHNDQRGQQGVQELAGLIAGCDLFVGLDSFPMHVAQAVGTPCVALFGINNPRCFMTAGNGPAIAVESDPMHRDTGRRNKIANVTFLRTDDSVMKTISVAQVLAAVEEIMAKPVPI